MRSGIQKPVAGLDPIRQANVPTAKGDIIAVGMIKAEQIKEGTQKTYGADLCWELCQHKKKRRKPMLTRDNYFSETGIYPIHNTNVLSVVRTWR